MESLREEKYWSEKVVEDFQIPLEKISEILAVSKKNGSSFDFERLHQYLDLTENFKNNLDRNNWPVWCFIAFAGNTELAKKISDFGVLTHNGMNALHFAIVGANFAVARYFIDELKRDPRACDSEGNNASYFAALIGSPSICAYLYKEYGVDPRVKNSGGKSALDIAVEYKRFHVLEYFVLESDLDLREFAESIFSFAVKYKKRALVENLYKKYAHNFQKNPLYSAIDAGSVDAVRCLIEKCGMVPDVECLHRAVVSGNSALIVHLIELCGLDPRATNCNGENALHIAAASDQTAKIVKMLMAYYGVDPLIESAEGTPLKRAQVAGNETCVALLGDSTQCHELVARSEWKNCVSEDFKLSAEKISEITQLSEHFGDLFDFQKLHQRLSTKNIRLCMSLDENTPVWIFFVLIGKFSAHFLNAKKFFVTALHLAAFVGELALVKMLVEKHHRDANERGGVNGWNALHFAVAGGSLDVTKYLTKVCEMDPGVSENREIYWRNSLNIAVDCDSTNVALYLICVWGINPRRTSGMDGVQNNALHRAAIRGNVELIKSFVADIYLCKMDPTVENKA
jgi:ankyrin repeat protein